MASIFSAIGDFFKSIFELIASMFQAFFGLFEGLIRLIVNFFTSVVQLFGDTFKGVFNVLGGVGNFLIANAAIIGVVVVGFFAYTTYQRRQGQTVTVGGKKVN